MNIPSEPVPAPDPTLPPWLSSLRFDGDPEGLVLIAETARNIDACEEPPANMVCEAQQMRGALLWLAQELDIARVGLATAGQRREEVYRVHLRRHTDLANALGMDPGFSADATVDDAVKAIHELAKLKAGPYEAVRSPRGHWHVHREGVDARLGCFDEDAAKIEAERLNVQENRAFDESMIRLHDELIAAKVAYTQLHCRVVDALLGVPDNLGYDTITPDEIAAAATALRAENEKAHGWLDKASIPRNDASGGVLSLPSRVFRLMKNPPVDE